jgi:two-component system phosphate regulon sensor histidine kinase PhoR
MLSLIGGSITAVAVALVVALAPVVGIPMHITDWTAIVETALAAGTLVAAVLYFFAAALIDDEVRRLEQNIQLTGEAEKAIEPYTPPAWLERVHTAAQVVFAALRRKNEQLVSRRRELEIQLRLAEAERQHMESIVQSIADGVLVTDSFNELAMANAAAAESMHFNLDAARRQPIERILHDPTLVKLIKDMRESGNYHNRRHLEHRITDGTRTRSFDLTLACIPNAQQEVAGVVAILRDITREKQIAEMQSDFVSGVSHELRTPLSSIKAYIEMLVDGEVEDDKTRNEFYNIIHSETNRLSRLIDNILNISRIESGIVRVQREDVHLNAVLHEAVEFMQPQARAKQITLAEQTPAVSMTIYADKDMIYQALLNLIGNAIKYTPVGGDVAVETTVDDRVRSVSIDVVDNGVGIPSEAVPHLFEKFFRVNDHKKMAKGTGLGLNLVKHIVETVHYGKVSVVSEVGKGSRFSIRLPLSEGAAAVDSRKPIGATHE